MIPYTIIAHLKKQHDEKIILRCTLIGLTYFKDMLPAMVVLWLVHIAVVPPTPSDIELLLNIYGHLKKWTSQLKTSPSGLT